MKGSVGIGKADGAKFGAKVRTLALRRHKVNTSAVVVGKYASAASAVEHQPLTQNTIFEVKEND